MKKTNKIKKITENSIRDVDIIKQSSKKRKEKKTSKAYKMMKKKDLIQEMELLHSALDNQNEVLKLAGTSARKYTELFKYAPSGSFILSKEGVIIEFNQSFAKMLGEKEIQLNNKHFDMFIHDSTKMVYDHFIERIFKGSSAETCELILSVDGASHKDVHLSGILNTSRESCIISVIDISNRKLIEKMQQINSYILTCLNSPIDYEEAINCILENIKQELKLEAVGIRFQQQDDFPYFAQKGFSNDFLLSENSLLIKNETQGICKDKDGNTCLACTCGLVLSQKTDPDNPFTTQKGSMFTNNSNPFMSKNQHKDRRLKPRKTCFNEGYCSVANIPIKANNTIIGMLQLNSKQTDFFTMDMILAFETICEGIGISFMHKQAEESLKQLNENLEDLVMERTTELIKSNTALIQAEEKYRTVADYTYDWEFWLAPDDNILYCSPSCYRITGYHAREFMQNKNLLLDILHPDDRNIFIGHKEKEDKAQDANLEIQFRIVRHDGAIRWIGHVCQPIYNDAGDFIGNRGSNRDITERKEMEQTIVNSEQKYRLLSENITDGVFICINGCFDYVNETMNRIFGYLPGELSGLKLTALARPEYRLELEKFLSQDFYGNCVNHLEIEMETFRKDGSVIFIEIVINFVSSEKVFYGVVHDLTEKKQLQKNILKAIIQTEEKERSYFSKELHDGLGPLLSTIKLYLQWSVRPNSNQSREEVIVKAEETLEEALTTVKEISNKLSPHLLNYHGLTSAVQSFIKKMEDTSAIKIIFESNLTRRLDAEIEATLYRTIIECINNTMKHAEAENISLQLDDSGNRIHIQYKDDGKGYNIAEKLSEQKGLGLFNLQNRIQTIGGKISMLSNPGEGVDYQINLNL